MSWRRKLEDDGAWERWSEVERDQYHRRYVALMLAMHDPQTHTWCGDGGDIPWALARAGYGSLGELGRASDAELLAAPGIGARRLRAIREWVNLHGPPPDWVMEE